jgi:hypothetical protein
VFWLWQKDRLPAAQTLVSISGMERSTAQTALALDKMVNAAMRGTERAFVGQARTPQNTKTSVDVFHSPHFLKPLVLAFQKACGRDPAVAATIRQCIATVRSCFFGSPST